jgi:Mg2+ and Co2+ transporter CorA
MEYILDEIERLDDRRESLVDVYREQKQENASKVLLFLTLVTSLFIPGQFLTGIWGMNFETMDELSWKYGYLMFWVLFICMTAGSLGFLYYLGFLKRV